MNSWIVFQPLFASALLHAGAAMVLLVSAQSVPRAPHLPEPLVVLEPLPPPKPMPPAEASIAKVRDLPSAAPPPAASKLRPANVTEPIRPAQPAVEPQRAAPVRLVGVRLSNGSGMLAYGEVRFTGSPGSETAGAQARAGASGTPRHPLSPARGPAPLDAVALADLSLKPQPPNLDSSLRRHYPAQLQAQGVEGEALVRAKILPTGKVGQVALLFESDPGFGQACLQTVRDSVWSSPRDAAGAEVSTQVRYRCQFRIGR
ncbi:MAG: hypothetical protein RJA70_2195 [Pseudomonadota bacterium]|jgi:TonB family protein